SDENKTKVEVDLCFGNRYTVVGNYIAVTVGMGPPKGFPAGTFDSTAITAGASIGAFAAPSNSPAIRTAYVDQLPVSGQTEFIPIPLKAVQLLPVQSFLNVGETARIRFFSYGGNV